jgi:cell division protein FtsW
MKGSNSSMLFVGAVTMSVLWIGHMRIKELLLILVLGIAGIFSIIGINAISNDRIFSGMRISTLKSRVLDKKTIYDLVAIEEDPSLGKYSDAWFKVRNGIRQPYTALLAIRQGGLFGKGSGNSTQKYIVTHVYSDYIYSLIVEEYGALGGVFIMFLYLSLLARGAAIARNCTDKFAKYAVGGLSLLISGQAFLHIFVNVDIGPMTGQTLPMISDGSFAFLMFCVAFGIILSISKMARNQIREQEEAAAPLYSSSKDDIQAAMDVLEQIDNQ